MTILKPVCPFCGSQCTVGKEDIISGTAAVFCPGHNVVGEYHKNTDTIFFYTKQDDIDDEVGFDLIKHLEIQKEFSLKNFGPGHRTKGIVDHIRKELEEIEEEPLDLYEWIDIILLGLDGAWRIGASPKEIVFALASKLEKNKKRKWPDWRTIDPDSAITHVKNNGKCDE